MKSTTLGKISNFLMIAIALIIVGVGAFLWEAGLGKLHTLLILYPAVLFIVGFAFLGLFFVERYRNQHSKLMKTQ
jgi:hypothetical protein